MKHGPAWAYVIKEEREGWLLRVVTYKPKRQSEPKSCMRRLQKVCDKRN